MSKDWMNRGLNRRRLLTGATLSLCAPALILPGRARAATPADALVIGGSIDNVASFDPAVDIGDVMQIASRNLYDFLVSPADGQRGRMVPDLAERWSVGPDGKAWTFHLNPQARFASGNPVTSADVAYTYVRVLKLGQAGGSRSLAIGFKADTIEAAIRTPDSATVVITFPDAYAPAIVMAYLSNWHHGIVDSVLLKQREQNGDYGSGFLRASSAGSGAYRLTQWRPNDLIVLERNDRAWRNPAPMRRILIRHVPEPNAMQLALQKGDIDLAYRPPLEHVKTASSDPALQTILGPAWLPQHVGMNVGRGPLANTKARQALKHLINYAALPTLCGEFSLPQQSLLEPHHVGYTGRAPFRLDLERARALLTEAGLPGGFTTTLRSRDYSVLPPVLEEFQQNAAKVGVQIKLSFELGSTLFPAWRGRDYDIAGGASNSYDDSDDGATDFMDNPDNEDRAYRGRRASRSAWQNAEAQTLVTAGRTEQDTAKRAAIYQRLETIFFDEGPFIMFCNDLFAMTARKSVQDVRFRPDLYLGAARKTVA